MQPKDAATLIILRDEREVLLGARSDKHVFMPNVYVFPGGSVDAEDERVPCPLPLGPEVKTKLCRSTSPVRARSLAMAAVRETYEETGLILGAPITELGLEADSAPLDSVPLSWRAFFAAGYAPALSQLDYLARAVTPPGNVRRFDARFFLIDAAHVHGQLIGNGELLDLRWEPLDTVGRLPLGAITEVVLEVLKHRLSGPYSQPIDERVPLFRQMFGRQLIEHY